MANLTFQSYILPLAILNKPCELILKDDGKEIACTFIPSIPSIENKKQQVSLQNLQLARFYFPTYYIPYCPYPDKIAYRPDNLKFQYITNNSYQFSPYTPVSTNYAPNVSIAYSLCDVDINLVKQLGVTLPLSLFQNTPMEEDEEEDEGESVEQAQLRAIKPDTDALYQGLINN
jgi:hypothetical protein